MKWKHRKNYNLLSKSIYPYPFNNIDELARFIWSTSKKLSTEIIKNMILNFCIYYGRNFCYNINKLLIDDNTYFIVMIAEKGKLYFYTENYSRLINIYDE